MPKLFPEAVINEVLDRCNIVELISSYVPLKRAGRNYRTTCPFHPEKTPSFIVSSDKQIFHCFGCGIGGNALTFIMQYEKVAFREALEILAQKNGVTLPVPEATDFQRAKEDFRKNLYDLYEKASEYYQQNLMVSPEAAEARNILKNRGISKEAAQRFRLGFAKNEWDALIQHLKSKNNSLSLIEKSGLIVAKENGGYYDRFRNRIIFPIADAKDRIVGFGARVLDNSLPKYINSPETPIYVKGKNLFGLSLAKEHLRTKDQAIVVEGYLDMIIPFEAGIPNIVASLGTALTPEQIRLIKRFTTRVVMLYDADLAGELATLRACELLIKEDMDVRIAALPQGHDPDSFVRQNGRESFLKIIGEAKPLFDHKLQYLVSKFDATTTTGKDRIVRDIIPTIKKFPNATTRAEYVKIAAESLHVDEKALFEDLNRFSDRDPFETEETSVAVSHFKLTQIPITERMLVKLMLEEIHLVQELKDKIEPSDFMEEKLRKIVQFVFNFFTQGKECKPSLLMNYLDDDEAINIISELATMEIHNCPNKERLVDDCVKRLKRDKIAYRCHELHRQIEAAQAGGNHTQLEKLIFEYNRLLKQRSALHGETGR